MHLHRRFWSLVVPGSLNLIKNGLSTGDTANKHYFKVEICERRLEIRQKGKMTRSRGLKKKSKTWFLRGHKFTVRRVKAEPSGHPQPITEQAVHYVRLSADEQSMVDNNPIIPDAASPGPAADSLGVAYKFLRPCKLNSATQQSQQPKSDMQR